MSMTTTRRFAFVADLEDRPGALNRVVSQFRHRGYEIDSLTLNPSHEPGVSRLTFTIRTTAAAAKRVGANLGRLLEVLHVEDVSGTAPVLRELVLVKLATVVGEHAALRRLLEAADARVIDAQPSGRVVEFAGPPEQVDALVEALRPFGVTEIVRSGAVVMVAEATKAYARDDVPHTSPTTPGRGLAEAWT